MKYISKIAVISLLLISLSSCGTVNGFGRDVSSTGHQISRATY